MNRFENQVHTGFAGFFLAADVLATFCRQYTLLHFFSYFDKKQANYFSYFDKKQANYFLDFDKILYFCSTKSIF